MEACCGIFLMFSYKRLRTVHFFDVYMILILILLFAIVCAVVLLNMLIAIMSYTAIEAQQDKCVIQFFLNKVELSVNSATSGNLIDQ